MSATEFGVNHPLAVKVWAKSLAVETRRKTYFGRFIGQGEDSLIQEKTELKKSAGDKITCGLRLQLTGDGVAGDATLEGNEEALGFEDDSVMLNQLRHATRTRGKMTEQRVPYNLRSENRASLSDWWSEREDTVMFNQLCGNTAVTDERYTGFNPITAPTSNRHLIAAGRADEDSLTSADTFKLELIDVARERALTANVQDGTGHMIRPLRVQGENMYVMFLHDFQVTALRRSDEWKQIQTAALQGGDIKNNPIFTGALGIYNNTILHAASRITRGVSSDGTPAANTRRAIFCGAQAATIAYGGGGGQSRYSWQEEMFDYGNQLGVSAGNIFGLKKNKFQPSVGTPYTPEDFGVIVVSTYASQATTA